MRLAVAFFITGLHDLIMLLRWSRVNSLVIKTRVSLHKDSVIMTLFNSSCVITAKITTHNLGPAVIFRCNSLRVILSYRIATFSDHFCKQCPIVCRYPGQQGGAGFADIVTGKVSPAGRSPQTYYKDDAQLPKLGNMDLYAGSKQSTFSLDYQYSVALRRPQMQQLLN